MIRSSRKPLGQPTRGKTASNRLRRVDNFILLREPALLTRTDGLFAGSLFVDLGYGFDARTTLESAARFRRVNPDLRVLGVEIDRDRVEVALPFATTGHSFDWADSTCHWRPAKPSALCVHLTSCGSMKRGISRPPMRAWRSMFYLAG